MAGLSKSPLSLLMLRQLRHTRAGQLVSSPQDISANWCGATGWRRMERATRLNRWASAGITSRSSPQVAPGMSAALAIAQLATLPTVLHGMPTSIA